MFSFNKPQHPLDRKVSLRFRIETICLQNPMLALTICIGIGSIITGIIMLIIFLILTPATIGGIV